MSVVAVTAALLPLSLLATASPAAAAGSCSVATITWDGGGGSTAWGTAANWNPNRLPTTTDHVCIPAAAPQPSVQLTAAATVLSVEATKPLGIGNVLTVTSATQSSSLMGSTLTGTLTGAGAKSLSGSSTWTGTISGSGAVTVPPGATLTAPTYCATLDETTLTNQGTLAIANASGFNPCVRMGGGATIENAGTLQLGDSQSDVRLEHGGGGTATVHNTGTITTPGTMDNPRVWYANVGLDNDGTINASRSLTISDGAGVSTGNYSASGGATLTFGDATVNGATASGSGTVEIIGTVTANGTGYASTALQNRITGTLTGAGPKSVGGASTWTGTISGSGPVTVPVGATLTTPTYCAMLDGATLTNLGTLVVGDASGFNPCIRLGNGATIENAGTLQLGDSQSDVRLEYGGGTATVHNTGTITTPGTLDNPRTVYNGVGLDNDGTVSATHDLTINDGAGASTGTYSAGAGATLSFGDATVDGASITGAGAVEVTGVVTALGAGLSVTTGNADIIGTLTGSGAKTLGGSSTWRGTISGTGVVTVPLGATLTAPTYCAMLDGPTLLNLGTLVIGDAFGFNPCIRLGNGATIENVGALQLGDSQSDVRIEYTGGSATVHNTGTITTPGGLDNPRTIFPGVVLDNDGTVNATHDLSIGETANYSAVTQTLARGVWAASNGAELSLGGGNIQKLAATVQLDGGSFAPDLATLTTITPAGSLTLRNGPAITTFGPLASAGTVTVGGGSSLTTTGAYTQTAGSTTLEASTATLTATGSTIDVQGGTFTGKGAAAPALGAKATIAPGLSPGVLSVTGPVTYTATGRLGIQIGGTTVGTQYDRLAVTGTAALAGTLDLSTINGFVPALGQTFTVLTATSRTGTFSNVTGLYAGGGRQYAVSYTATSVVVTVVAGPAGPDLVVSTAPTTTPFVTGAPGRLAVAVTNAGGTATSGTVTAAVTLGAGLSYASASGTGWTCNGSGTSATCTRTGAIASGAAAPTITLNVNVAAGAVPTTTASTTVSGGGDSVGGNNVGSTSITAKTLVTPIAVFTPGGPQSVLTGTTISFDGSASTGSISTYEWDFGDGASGTGVAVTHRYTTPGVYTAVLRVSNDVQVASSSRRITVLDSIPIVADAGDDRVVGSGTSVSFTGNQSVPIPGIEAFEWFFSDTATTDTGRDVTHTFVNNTATPVHVPVTLTITRASVTETDTIDVTVMPASGQGLAVTITNGASGLPGAAVTVVDARGVRYQATTNGTGVGTVYGLPNGALQVYAYADGYQPKTGTATVANGTGALTIALTTGAVGSTVLESRRLTYEEIVAAGIDPADPANQNVVHFTICLAFNGAVCTVTIDGNANEEGSIFGGGVGGSFGGTGGCTSSECVFTLPDGRTASGSVEFIEGQPVWNFLLISGEARWLKEFFEVKLLVVNAAPAGFDFTGGNATLTIPDGLSLAPTSVPQNPGIDLATIPGGGQGTATWIVRGDLQGSYDLEARYTATLEPVGRSVLLQAKTANPLKVWGRGAVEMIVDADDAAVANEPYRVRIGLHNITTGPEATPVYNPVVELYPVTGANFIYQPREDLEQGAAVIAPGATFWTDYFILIPQITGELNVAGSFVFLDGSEEDPVPPAVIVSHPRQTPLALTGTAQAGAAQLTWAAVPGATDYQIFTTADPTTAFGDTPAATVAAGTLTTTVPATPDVLTYYAVSATVGGKAVLRHALVGVTALPAPAISIGDATVVEGDGGNVSASFPVRLAAPSVAAVTVGYSTSNGTAISTAPNDYAPMVNKVLTIPAGATGGSIKVTVKGDGRIEPDETFDVTLSNPTNGVLGRSVATGTILDNDTPGSAGLSIGDVTVVEGNVGTSTAVFDVTLDQASASTVSVPWSMAPGSATPPGDYASASGTATFAPGTTAKTISVVVKGDVGVEPTEGATVNLGAPTGAVVLDGAGALTILDDDTAPVATAISIGDATVVEGDTLTHNAALTVRLAQPAAGPVTVAYSTSAGSATATSDYTTKTGTVTIAAGAVAGSVKVPVIAEGLAEGNESLTVTLSSPTGGATLGRSVGTVTIVNDDAPSSVVSIGEGSVVEGNSGTRGVAIPFTLSQPQLTPVTVVVNTAIGTAVGADFTGFVNKTVTIPAGATSATVTITIKSDLAAEATETFSVVMSAPVGATIGRPIGVFSILDDD